jgi:hypothetical protein
VPRRFTRARVFRNSAGSKTFRQDTAGYFCKNAFHLPDTNAGRVMGFYIGGRKARMFFFEKKNQKTFAFLSGVCCTARLK